jgi:hypothetical protein
MQISGSFSTGVGQIILSRLPVTNIYLLAFGSNTGKQGARISSSMLIQPD